MDERMKEIETRLAAIKSELDMPGADVDALGEEVRALKAEQETLKAQAEQESLNERAEKRAAVLDEVSKTAKPVMEFKSEEMEATPKMSNIEVRKTEAYINAFANYIKTNRDDECRALLTENVSGSVPVPVYIEERVKTAWENESIMQYVRKTYLRGNVKAGFEISGTDAVIHTEGTGAPAEETLVLGVVTLTPQSIKKWITISDEVYDMGGTALLDYVYDELTHKIAKKAADTLIGAIATLGTASTANAVGAAQVKAAPAVGTIAKALGLLSDEAANPIIVMNKGTWSAFKDAQYEANYAVDPFEGLTVVYNNALPTYASASTGSSYVIVGDFGVGAQANFPNGDEITIKFDELSLAEADLVKLVGRTYVGIGPVAPFAFTNIVK